MLADSAVVAASSPFLLPAPAESFPAVPSPHQPPADPEYYELSEQYASNIAQALDAELRDFDPDFQDSRIPVRPFVPEVLKERNAV